MNDATEDPIRGDHPLGSVSDDPVADAEFAQMLADAARDTRGTLTHAAPGQ